MIEIEKNSQAWDYLMFVAGKEGEVYKLSLDVRGDAIALKVNELMWTPSLGIKALRPIELTK